MCHVPSPNKRPPRCSKHFKRGHWTRRLATSLKSVVVCCLGTLLYSCSSCFSKIPNPKSTNLAGSLDRSPIHRHFTNSKTKTLSRDRSIIQHLIHTTGIRCFLSIHRLQCDSDCDSRAPCVAAVRSHNTTPPLRPRRGLIALGGRHMVEPEGEDQKKKFLTSTCAGY